VVSYTFEAAGRETLLENRKVDGTGLAIFTNTYDPVSNRLTVLELDGARCTFGYDSTYQLTLEQRSGPNAYNTSYVYDPLGSRVRKFDSGALTASQYNAANELILATPPSGPPTTSTWDANGNLATQVTGADLTTYTWDPENRPLRVSDNSGITTAAYSTDGLRQK
jgi:YD repeat-containing protein